MIIRSIKRLFGFGKQPAQQPASPAIVEAAKQEPAIGLPEECEQCYTAVATLQQEDVESRQQLLDGEQQSVDKTSKSDLKQVASRFSQRKDGATAEGIKDEQNRINRAIEALNAHQAEELKQYSTACTASTAAANETLKQQLAEAKAGLDRAVADLLPIEKAARTLAETIHSDKVKQANSTAKAAIAGFEADYQTKSSALKTLVEGKIARLKARLAELDRELIALKLDPLYDRIDMGFLKLRKGSPDTQVGLPLFALFTLSDPICEISCTGNKPYSAYVSRATYTTQTNPALFSQYVSPSFKKLKGATQSRLEEVGEQYNSYYSAYSVTGRYRTEFSGVIPPDVREIIKKARTQFDNIYIVTEAPEWELSFEEVVIRAVPVGDPLVIGEKAGLFWLVKPFDTTPAEEHAWREFSRNTKENRE